MKCPSCNQSPASFLRYVFTLQGVSFRQSMKGYFRCDHCGTLLRVAAYTRHFWLFIIGTAVVLALFTLLYRRLMVLAGTGATAAVWIGLVLVIVLAFTYGLWKYAKAEKVDSEKLKS